MSCTSGSKTVGASPCKGPGMGNGGGGEIISAPQEDEESEDDADVPPEFLCSITMQPMKRPVSADPKVKRFGSFR
jgi:hypothetical protein